MALARPGRIASTRARCRSRATAAWGVPSLSSDSGQALVLGLLFIALVLVLMLAVPGLATGYADRAGVASAADAAALACASQAIVTQQVDARGNVYQTFATVDVASGPTAAAASWSVNLRRVPVRTVSFAATPSGPDCTVVAKVQASIGPLAVIARRTLTWSVRAEARTYVKAP